MLNSFLRNGKKTSNLYLNAIAKKELYGKFFFYNLDLFLSDKISFLNERNTSFREVLLRNFFLQKVNSNFLCSLARARIISLSSSFLYFDIGSKYTVLKPKFKVFFPNVFSAFLQKEILLFSHKSFLSFLRFKDLKQMLGWFQSSLFREKYSSNFKVVCQEKHFFFKKLVSTHEYFKQFFFYGMFSSIFSIFQKRMNFLQFNIFFKKHEI